MGMVLIMGLIVAKMTIYTKDNFVNEKAPVMVTFNRAKNGNPSPLSVRMAERRTWPSIDPVAYIPKERLMKARFATDNNPLNLTTEELEDIVALQNISATPGLIDNNRTAMSLPTM